MRIGLALIVLLIGVSGVAAQSASDSALRHAVLSGYWENDGGILKRNNVNDRQYTNGFGFSLSHQADWAGRLTDLIPFGGDFDRDHARVGYLLAQQMYTPDNILAHRLIADDRPYAGYLFGGIYLQRINERTVDHFQLDIGTVGPGSHAKGLQRWVHRIVDADSPNGWDNQIPNEMTAQFTLRKKWRWPLADIALNDIDVPLQIELLPQVEGALGSVYRHLEAGATLRAGFNLPDDFGPGRLMDMAAYGPGATRQSHRFGIYGFLRAAGRASEHNIFLDGTNWRDSHRVDKYTFTGQWQAGLAAQVRCDKLTLEVSYSQTFLSREYRSQQGGHEYAALAIHLHCAF